MGGGRTRSSRSLFGPLCIHQNHKGRLSNVTLRVIVDVKVARYWRYMAPKIFLVVISQKAEGRKQKTESRKSKHGTTIHHCNSNNININKSNKNNHDGTDSPSTNSPCVG